MNFKNSLFALVLVGSSLAVAHDHYNLTKEKVVEMLIGAEAALNKAEKVNENLKARNENLKAQVAYLASQVKHELSKEHHELVKALVHLERAIFN